MDYQVCNSYRVVGNAFVHHHNWNRYAEDHGQDLEDLKAIFCLGRHLQLLEAVEDSCFVLLKGDDAHRGKHEGKHLQSYLSVISNSEGCVLCNRNKCSGQKQHPR